MRNEEIAEMFDTLANVLEFKGENPFRLNAYRKAARVLRDLTEEVETLVARRPAARTSRHRRGHREEDRPSVDHRQNGEA